MSELPDKMDVPVWDRLSLMQMAEDLPTDDSPFACPHPADVFCIDCCPPEELMKHIRAVADRYSNWGKPFDGGSPSADKEYPKASGVATEQEVASVIPEDFDPAVAFKADRAKAPLGLIPFRPLVEIAQVLDFGAKKYEAHNWRKGFDHSRLIDALKGHIGAYWEGEDNDPETGLCHLAHAGCMLLFLMETRHTHPELDDRYQKGISLGYGR